MEEKKNLTIKQWAEDDRPREKMLKKGSDALSNAELLAILISTGTREESALDLAKKLLLNTSNDLFELGCLTPNEMIKKVKGIGKAKAVTISAALELGKRRKLVTPKEVDSFKTSNSVADEFISLSDIKHEEFWILLLNKANKEISRYRISSGGISRTVVDPRIVLKYAIEHLASSLILIHNHPSGSLSPSNEDIKLTKKIISCCESFDISVLDHIIIGKNKYLSFSDEGILR